MDALFNLKTLLRLLAVAIVLAALLVLVSERIENWRPEAALAQREVTRLVEHTVIVTQVVERVVTATATTGSLIAETEAVPALPPTAAAPAVSPTTSLAVLPDGLVAWCLPKPVGSEEVVPVTGQTALGLPPDGAELAAKVDGILTIYTQVASCTFVVSFNQPVPEGVRLQVQDLGPAPFVDASLAAFSADPAAGFVQIEHPFVVDPPFWRVTHTVSVRAPDGSLLWRQPVVFARRWQPQPCPDGGYPDPVSLQCPPGAAP